MNGVYYFFALFTILLIIVIFANKAFRQLTESRFIQSEAITAIAEKYGISKEEYSCTNNDQVSNYLLDFKGIYVIAAKSHKVFDLDKTGIASLYEEMLNAKDIYFIFIVDYYKIYLNSNKKFYITRKEVINQKLFYLQELLKKYTPGIVQSKTTYHTIHQIDNYLEPELYYMYKYYNNIVNLVPKGTCEELNLNTENKSYKFQEIDNNDIFSDFFYYNCFKDKISIWIPEEDYKEHMSKIKKLSN